LRARERRPTLGQASTPTAPPGPSGSVPQVRRVAQASHQMSIAQMIDEAASRTKGRPAQFLPAHVSRELTEEDLLAIAEGNAPPAPPIGVKQLRASHHKAARLVGQGLAAGQISAITGYSTERLRQLNHDPQFAELVAYYKGLDEKAWEEHRVDIAGRLAAITADTMEVIHERLLEDPNSFALKDLRAIAELGLDRIGHGKTSVQQVEHTHRVDEEQLARIRNSTDAPAQVSSTDRDALVRLALSATESHPPAEASEGEQGEGPCLREAGREGTSDAARTTIHVPPVD
jgi:hypothetical protein